MAKKEVKEAEVAKKVSAKDVKKDAAKVAKAVSETAKDLRALTEQQLQGLLQTAKADLLRAQKMLKSNELPASHVIRKTKKLIARIHTVLVEKSNEKEAK
ncbi:50S ribosomal protein L29 [Candidatus Saccharibacteria bacterium]|nr:50S ribosomal protein L29 [Candidatus Saccharibacteria bacterium]MCL1962680.1 50S ribosomal protein L29 [Candidatus Saccharibacteria bacterium]